VESADLATRAVELVSTLLAGTVARIPGSPSERLYLLLAVRMHQSSAGSAIFRELESMPNDPGVRRVVVARLIGLAEQDRQFAADLGRAVREALESPGPPNRSFTYNMIGGNVTGTSVQADSVSNSIIGRDIDQSRHTHKNRRIGLGGLLLIIAMVLGLGATGLVVTNLVRSYIGGPTRSGPRSGPGTGDPVAGTGVNPEEGITLPDQGQGSGGSDCGRAERPVLTLSPTQGTINTKITVSGVGFIPNGHVNITFHASQMGEATTDCHGAFGLTLPIPEKEFYQHFPNQSFDVHATEWTSSGQYQGNGDFNGAQFHLLG